MRGFTNRQPSVVSSIVRAPRSHAPSALSITYGARVIDSTPPATNTSPSPAPIAWAALFTAWRPDPHSRFTVCPATSTGSPASRSGHPGDVAVVLARAVRAAEDDVLDQGRIDPRPLDDRADREGGEVVGANPASAPP